VRNLDSDLVTILLRALAKEPDRRFQSAGDLALDIRAYLAHEPIAARRDTSSTRRSTSTRISILTRRVSC
jgi:hypothetical protein